jgi:hypothetical protein
MRFHISSRPEAEDKLALIWMSAPDKQAVTRASHEAEQILAASPEQGQEFYGDWLLDVPPLHVVYQYSPDNHLVTILDIWYH